MTIRSSIAIIFIAAIIGAFIGGAIPYNTPNPQAASSAPLAPSVATPAGYNCKAERAELASTKTQLVICMAFDSRVPEPEASGASGPSKPTDPRQEIKENRRLLRVYPEAVIVQHPDGRTGVYKPDEWPIDGNGVIVARKLTSGDIAWYSGPDAGPRSDPGAFKTFSASPDFVEPIIETTPDGTIMVNGEPADQEVQRIFGGKLKAMQGEAP